MTTRVADEPAVETVHETDAAALPAVVEQEHRTETPGVTFTAEQVALIKETVCNPGLDRQGNPQYATDAELDLFLAVCKRTGLDPFARQVYAVFRWNPAAGRKAMQIQTSIDGFRVIAERSSTYAGQAGPFWCGRDGKWSDVWLEDGYPAAARVGVLRRGFSEPMFAVAKWAEFVQTEKDGGVSKMWKALPTVMLAKCAEAQALRRAFPNDLSGLYTAEEMAQADNPESASRAPTPPLDASPFLSPANVAAVKEKAAAAGLLSDDLAGVVGHATDNRTYDVAEVLKTEVAALRDAMSAAVAAKTAPDDQPAEPDPGRPFEEA